MNWLWATLVRVTDTNINEMFNPKLNAAGATDRQVSRDGSGRPRNRNTAKTAHQIPVETTRRHQAITDPEVPGHLITEKLRPKQVTAPTMATWPTRG